MPIFYRANYTQFWLTLSSDETLGLLDSSYLEDYFGVDGQISLYDGTTRYPVLMSEISPEPAPHEVFSGWVPMASLPNGTYQIQGRVRDPYGNYTILGAVTSPMGGERILDLSFEIQPGFGHGPVEILFLRLQGGDVLSLPFTDSSVTLRFLAALVSLPTRIVSVLLTLIRGQSIALFGDAMHVGDYGNRLTIQAGRDISASTAFVLYVKRQDGTTFTRNLGVGDITNATAGTLVYIIENGDLSIAGQYVFQLCDVTPGSVIWSDIGTVTVVNHL